MTCSTCAELTRHFKVCCVFLLNFMLFQIIYRRGQVKKPSSLSYSQALVDFVHVLLQIGRNLSCL